MNKWSKGKTLEDKPRSGWPWLFYNKCVRNVIKKAVKVFVIILQDRKVKKINFTIVSKFRAQQYEDTWPTMVGKPWREKGGAHADMVSEGFARFIAKGDWLVNSREPFRDHLDYHWWDNIQRYSPQYTGRAKTVTTLRLGKCFFGHTFGSSYILCITT